MFFTGEVEKLLENLAVWFEVCFCFIRKQTTYQVSSLVKIDTLPLPTSIGYQ